jgi:copper chaperone CopZ
MNKDEQPVFRRAYYGSGLPFNSTLLGFCKVNGETKQVHPFFCVETHRLKPKTPREKRNGPLNLRNGRLFYVKEREGMPTTILKIEGMTCDHCVRSVREALSSLPGVKKAEVSLVQKQAVVQSEGPLDVPMALKAVEQEGYKAEIKS